MSLSFLEKVKLFRHFNKIRKDKKMISKLKSRKLWVAVVAAALMPIFDALGVDQALTEKLIGLAMLYIVGESAVDASREFKKPALIEAEAEVEAKAEAKSATARRVINPSSRP